MKKNFALGMMIIILIGGIGLLLVDSVFTQQVYAINDNSEQEKKLEKTKAEQEKEKKLEKTKAEQEKEIEKIKTKLAKEKYEKKQLEKSNEYQEKLKKIKEKYLNKIQQQSSDELESFSQFGNFKEKLTKKSEEIRENLNAHLDKLDLRTQNILDNINDGKYMGDKINSSNYTETYQLVFDSIDAFAINDKSNKSSLTGKMNFTIYDRSKSDLKLELYECQITVDQISYNCGFGKAKTISSGHSSIKDSLIVVAFLEDNLLEEVHATMKIFLKTDIPITEIEQSPVSIIYPQSTISNMWFLNGTATLNKIVLLYPEEDK